MTARTIQRVETTPPVEPGFLGRGHTAVQVLDSTDLPASDPFVLLMDDRLDLGARKAIGGAHPHAGLETVTLILEGSLYDRDEGELAAGDVVWMTAGRGIIHNEHVEAGGRVRILQLWIRLPARDRTLAPRFEVVRAATTPTRHEPGVMARVYSGASGELRASTANRAPITLVDLDLQPGARFEQELPASYQGFAYVIAGDATIGGAHVATGQVGWLGGGDGPLAFVAGASGARVVLYTGEPQREPLVHYGPFVAGNLAEIHDFNRRFRNGEFTSMSAIAQEGLRS
jgi:hypothetical protein